MEIAVRPIVLTALAALSLAVAAPARAAVQPEGEFESPLGRLSIHVDGDRFVGRLDAPSALCRFKQGDEVLRGTLLDDSLAGQLRVCVSGPRCRVSEDWATALLLVSADKLAGSVHVAKGCTGPFGKKGGVTLVRTAGAGSSPLPPGEGQGEGASRERYPQSRRARAQALLREGKAYLDEGRFEAARRQFMEAIAVDPGIPEAYNGVGVTLRMRNDLGEALAWYKKALAIDPDFGDAYYNMACVYALEGKPQLALRYLKIAAMNGYASADGIEADPDLGTLRELPEYQALVRAKM